MEPTTATHVDLALSNDKVESLDITLEFAASRNRKTLYIFFSVEGVERPWKSRALEISLGKKKTTFSGQIQPEIYFDKKEGICPHVCIYILDQDKKHLKSTVKWSVKIGQ